MLYAVAVVGTQAQPDSISLSQLYYDRLSHHHNKNHNPPLPRQIMIMTREHSFLVPFAEFDWSLQIWNMMGVVSCAAAAVLCYARAGCLLLVILHGAHSAPAHQALNARQK